MFPMSSALANPPDVLRRRSVRSVLVPGLIAAVSLLAAPVGDAGEPDPGRFLNTDIFEL